MGRRVVLNSAEAQGTGYGGMLPDEDDAPGCAAAQGAGYGVGPVA